MKRSEEYVIRGPFGIWPFPILNALLQFIALLRSLQQPVRRAGIRTYQFVRDEKGRIIEIVEIEK